MRRILTALLISGGTLPCLSSAQSPSQKNEQPFSITITPPAAEVKARSDVYLKVRMTNTSNHDLPGRAVFSEMGGLNSMYQYDCWDSKGNSVKKEARGSGLGSVGEYPTLKPGESREEEASLDRACDLGRPGQYEIQASSIIPGDPAHRVVKSNRIKITVKP
jgi:hypothetical protein